MALPVTNGVVTVLPPPEGYIVDFDNPQRNGDVTCYWLTGVGSLLALVFLGQRLYVKGVIRRQLSFDDGILIIAWLFSIAIQALIVRAFVFQYTGVHAWEIPFSKFQETYFYTVYLHTIVYAPCVCLAKLVLLFFYLQLGNQSMWFRWATYATMFINVGASTGILFSSIFACSPIAMGWDLTITDGKCIDRPAMYEATAAFGVIVDCFIIFIPIPMVLRLHTSRSKKAGLLMMFVLGSITVITSFVRLILLVTEIKDADSTWVGGPINYWVSIEANLLIMCASLPTLRQFMQLFVNKFPSSNGNSHYYVHSASGGKNNMPSIGGISSRSKNKRARETDTEIIMETLAERDGDSWTQPHDVEGNVRGSADGDSNKAILDDRGIEGMQATQVK